MKNETTSGDGRVFTGVPNLDALLMGGLPKGTTTVIGGAPGAGKTILSQQIVFRNASPRNPAVFFHTLSEPTVKTLRYLKQFSFFNPAKLGKSVHFIDLGGILRQKGLEKACATLMEHIKELRPAYVVIDSFKAFSDLAGSNEELRKFSYEVIINLVAWECTTFLLGEYSEADLQVSPVFSIVDGLVMLSAHESSGEQQRFIQIVKMRGTGHDRDRHPFLISTDGVNIYAPRLTIRRAAGPAKPARAPFRRTGIASFDGLLGKGIRPGFSLLVSGTTGTGKTLFALEAIYRGARELGEKGVYFSFKESPEQLLATAAGLGMDLAGEVRRGKIDVVHVPQPDILVEKNLQMMHERVERFGAKRIAVDSLSVFLHKIKDPQIIREKVYQLAAIVQMNGGVGYFVSNAEHEARGDTDFSVEETILDGIVRLASEEDGGGLGRRRSIEVYKLRNAVHAAGRRGMAITPKGILVSPLPAGREPSPRG